MLPCLPTQVKVDSAVVRKIPITLICVSIIRQLLNASHASRHGAHRDELSQGSCLVELTLGREERDEVISERVNEVALGMSIRSIPGTLFRGEKVSETLGAFPGVGE